jgi:hypothetical protein
MVEVAQKLGQYQDGAGEDRDRAGALGKAARTCSRS